MTIDTTNLAEQVAEAFDLTLERWALALDFRDRASEDHVRQVTDTTLRLADALGLSASEQVHVRRGAWLHDIGKMIVPDSILLKPGALSPAEWEVMRQHPTFAYQLLEAIEYLRPALDIPYCHHEKWDGSGYPRGLKGEQIPLAARIFAVVDVRDALLSHRPYRAGWAPEMVDAFIESLAGSHFDPRIVEAFTKLRAEG